MAKRGPKPKAKKETPSPEAPQEQPKVEAKEEIKEEVKAPKKEKPKEIQADVVGTKKELLLEEGNTHLVYFQGTPRMWSLATYQTMMRSGELAKQIELPEGSKIPEKLGAEPCTNC